MVRGFFKVSPTSELVVLVSSTRVRDAAVAREIRSGSGVLEDEIFRAVVAGQIDRRWVLAPVRMDPRGRPQRFVRLVLHDCGRNPIYRPFGFRYYDSNSLGSSCFPDPECPGQSRRRSNRSSLDSRKHFRWNRRVPP